MLLRGSRLRAQGLVASPELEACALRLTLSESVVRTFNFLSSTPSNPATYRIFWCSNCARALSTAAFHSSSVASAPGVVSVKRVVSIAFNGCLASTRCISASINGRPYYNNEYFICEPRSFIRTLKKSDTSPKLGCNLPF